MAFRDCIISARDQGALTPDEADELIHRYEDHVRAQGGTAHPGGPEAAAKDALAKEISDEASRKKRLAQLSADKAEEIRDYLDSYEGPDGQPDVKRAAEALIENRNNELGGTVSVVGQRDALIGRAHGVLERHLYEFRRRFLTGSRRNRARLEHTVDEAFGTSTGDTAARGWLEAWRKSVDELADMFNAAGGAINKMADYFPQSHDARRISKLGRDAWRTFIKPRLAVDKMVDPLTGGALSPQRLDETLDVIWRRIVTNGASEMEPSSQARGRGALANQRQEERFLHFKDANAWREYAQAFGNPDVYAVMMDHLHGLAKDVAALRVLGPNPNATVEWLRQVIDSEAAKAAIGEKSLYRGRAEPGRNGQLSTGSDRLEDLWRLVNGSVTTSSANVAAWADTAKNAVTSALLGGTALTSLIGDPAQASWASRFAGLPALRALASLPRQILSSASKRDVVRAGVVMADALDHLQTNFRHLSWAARSREATQYLPDRVFAWSGLTPLTRAERRANALSIMFEAGDRAGQTLDEIAADGVAGDRFARFLRGTGIDAATWDLIRSVKGRDQAGAGRTIGPADLYSAAGGTEGPLFDAGLRWSEAVHAFIEEATPGGTARARRALSRANKKGTIAGEFQQQALSYMVYPASVMMSLVRATALELSAGAWRGAAFLTSAFVSLSAAGAMITQMKAIRRGEDFERMDQISFWLRSIAQGGALGFYGDWLLADYRRGVGDQLSRFAGPVGNAAISLVGATGGVQGLSEDYDVNTGARLVRWARNNTPVQSMWWLRPVADRLIWDRLQRLADPKADRAWRRKATELAKQGRGYYWPPGQAFPSRLPIAAR